LRSLLVFAWRVVLGCRARLRQSRATSRASRLIDLVSQGLHIVSSRACRAGPLAFSGCDERWLSGHSAARSVLAAVVPRFRPSVERSCRALHSWARGWRWLRLAVLWLADCTHQLRIGARPGSSFNAAVMSSALLEFAGMRAAALCAPSVSARYLRRVALPSEDAGVRTSGLRAVVPLFRARRAGWGTHANEQFQRAHRFLSKLLHPIGVDAIPVACHDAISSRSLSHRDLSAALHET
jgi:hypothetical protein